jgi:alginate O-acetyltransferase complex protein AlgJ
MISKEFFLSIIATLILNTGIHASKYKELVPDFNRMESQVCVRVIDKPTLANLGYAAYISNPVRFDPEKQKPDIKKVYTIDQMTFNGALINPVNSIDELPLSKQELGQPLAWEPLMEELWKNMVFDGLKQISSKINSQKWGDPSIFKPYQEVVAAYIHQNQNQEIWVEVEFKYWVDFLENITDNDNDGIKEIYGKLNIKDLKDEPKFNKSMKWIQEEYTKKELSKNEIIDWFNVLASYWYPTLNTDMVEVTEKTVWPDKNTERPVKRDMGSVTIENPTVIIRGVPHEKPIYNIFVVKGVDNKGQENINTDTIETFEKSLDTALSRNFVENNIRFARELQKNGGSYPKWYEQQKDFIDAQKKLLKEGNPDIMGIVGVDNWLFFKKSLEYTTAKGLLNQKDDRDAFKHIVEFNKYLENRNIDMIFVPMPSKVEVYPEKLFNDIEPPNCGIIQPYGRQFLSELQKAGVEVIDVLPRYLEAKSQDTANGYLYQKHDTHWRNRALQITAEAISQRLKEYSWYSEAEKHEYKKDVVQFKRQGDIVSRLPDSLQSNYPPANLTGAKIYNKEDKPFSRQPDAEIMLIGDSFTGVFELIDCKSAGIGANIAYKSSLPLDIVTSWGGGPLVRAKMLRTREKYLGNKKVIIYLMVDRDLYNYSQGWQSINEMGGNK